ncbi:MAG: FkbH like protein, partial [Pseudomonadota bacterium]
MNQLQAPPQSSRPPSFLSQLRALRRNGIAEDPVKLRALLADCTDPIDLDAAGGLLASEKVRTELAKVDGIRQQRIAILGSSTLDTLPNLLTAMTVRDGMLADFATTDFNQWRLEVMSGAPTLAPFEPRITACLLDEEVVFDSVTQPHNVAEIEQSCTDFSLELADWTERCRGLTGGLIVLSTIPLSARRSGHVIDYAGKARLSAAWSAMNTQILALASQIDGVIVLDAGPLAEVAGGSAASDRMRLAAGHAFSPEFLQAYAEEITAIARADLGLAKKALALDLDNTLWGGVVGDVGVGALALGRAWPGAPHRELQVLAKSYAAQGVHANVANDAAPKCIVQIQGERL